MILIWRHVEKQTFPWSIICALFKGYHLQTYCFDFFNILHNNPNVSSMHATTMHQRTCDKINNIRSFFWLISWHLPQIWHQLSIFASWDCITQLILYTRACRFYSNFLQPRRILSANLWFKGSAHLIFQKPPFEYSRIC